MKKRSNELLAAVCALVLILSLAACGASAPQATPNPQQQGGGEASSGTPAANNSIDAAAENSHYTPPTDIKVDPNILKSGNGRTVYYVTARGGLNVRGGPDAEYEKLGVLPELATVYGDGERNGWIYVFCSDPKLEGWVKTEYLEQSAIAAQEIIDEKNAPATQTGGDGSSGASGSSSDKDIVEAYMNEARSRYGLSYFEYVAVLASAMDALANGYSSVDVIFWIDFTLQAEYGY
jgi:uncharacterized protein YraI